MTKRDSPRRRRALPQLLIVACCLSPMLMTGCYRKLFDDKLPNSQFETHDRVRNGPKALTIKDPYGAQQPNLRARLDTDR